MPYSWQQWRLPIRAPDGRVTSFLTKERGEKDNNISQIPKKQVETEDEAQPSTPPFASRKDTSIYASPAAKSISLLQPPHHRHRPPATHLSLHRFSLLCYRRRAAFWIHQITQRLLTASNLDHHDDAAQKQLQKPEPSPPEQESVIRLCGEKRCPRNHGQRASRSRTRCVPCRNHLVQQDPDSSWKRRPEVSSPASPAEREVCRPQCPAAEKARYAGKHGHCGQRSHATASRWLSAALSSILRTR